MNTSITSKDTTGVATVGGIGSTDAKSGTDGFDLINDLQIKLATLFRQMRDTLRQYNESQQQSNYQLALSSYNTKMDSIQKDYESGMKACDGELVAGLTSTVFSGLGLMGAGGEASQALGQFGSGIGETFKSSFDRESKELSRQSQELAGKADFQHSLADGAEKRSEQTLDMARQASSDLRQMLDTIAQIHDRLTSALQSR